MNILGLRSIIYPSSSLEEDTAWWTDTLGFPPYFNEPYYVGFNVGGYELGLNPSGDKTLGQQTYFGVEDVNSAVTELKNRGCTIDEEPQDRGGGIITASVRRTDGQRINLIYNPYILPNQPLKHVD